MILTDTKNTENITSVMDFLKGKKTKPLVFEITDNAASRLDEFCKYLMKATHCIFITEENTVLKENPFILYASGFLSGRNIPTFVPKTLKTNNKIVLKDFTPFDSIKKLVEKLKKNYPAYLQEEAKKNAHKRLFDEGIPFTPDSFSFNIAKQNEEVCNLFVEAGMDVNCRDSAGTPMICIAARSGRNNMIENKKQKKNFGTNTRKKSHLSLGMPLYDNICHSSNMSQVRCLWECQEAWSLMIL